MVRVCPALFGLPALLEAVLRNGLAGEPSLAVESLGSSRSPADLTARLTGSAAVVVTRDDTLDSSGRRTLTALHPRALVLVLAADGGSAALHRGSGPPTVLHDPSMDDLAHAIRDLADGLAYMFPPREPHPK